MRSPDNKDQHILGSTVGQLSQIFILYEGSSSVGAHVLGSRNMEPEMPNSLLTLLHYIHASHTSTTKRQGR